MIAALILFLPLFLAALLLFLKRRPSVEPSERGVMARFDRAVFLVALVAAGAAAAYFRWTTGESAVDRGWWPVLAGLSALVLSSVVLFSGFFIRNLLFNPRRGD